MDFHGTRGRKKAANAHATLVTDVRATLKAGASASHPLHARCACTHCMHVPPRATTTGGAPPPAAQGGVGCHAREGGGEALQGGCGPPCESPRFPHFDKIPHSRIGVPRVAYVFISSVLRYSWQKGSQWILAFAGKRGNVGNT